MHESAQETAGVAFESVYDFPMDVFRGVRVMCDDANDTLARLSEADAADMAEAWRCSPEDFYLAYTPEIGGTAALRDQKRWLPWDPLWDTLMLAEKDEAEVAGYMALDEDASARCTRFARLISRLPPELAAQVVQHRLVARIEEEEGADAAFRPVAGRLYEGEERHSHSVVRALSTRESIRPD